MQTQPAWEPTVRTARPDSGWRMRPRTRTAVLVVHIVGTHHGLVHYWWVT